MFPKYVYSCIWLFSLCTTIITVLYPTFYLSWRTFVPTCFAPYYRGSNKWCNGKFSLAEPKSLKLKCPLHSWFTLLSKWWKKVYARYHNEMQMIPFMLGRQIHCIIFFVLMVIGAIKLIVRPKTPLLFENRIAQILVYYQWSNTFHYQEKQDILYWEMTICTYFTVKKQTFVSVP